MELADEMYKGKLPIEKRSDNMYQIEFKNVSFKYPDSENYALKNFSMKLKIGEKLAIVGMNGSGKTTMIKLLCRLYDPTEGEILLNGVNIKKFKHSEYSRLFSVVFQDYILFPHKLGENVAVSTEYEKDRVEEALTGAGFGERLETLEKGLDSYIYTDFDDDGIEISGGEAQKIAIARAVYKEAPFILMDEPTASLDPIAEYEIYSNLDNIIGSKTAIYISHRLSSCRFCEKIAVFDKGQLIQTGSHSELIKDENGKYYEMWTAQSQYYQTAD
jgi:ATP-binding cassette subfamily B protein